MAGRRRPASRPHRRTGPGTPGTPSPRSTPCSRPAPAPSGGRACRSRSAPSPRRTSSAAAASGTSYPISFQRATSTSSATAMHVVLVHEAHLDVELGELRLPVGAEVLVPVAARDLVVALHAGDHQQLLEQLRALRQGVPAAGLQPGRDQEVARALGGRPGQGRRLDLDEAVVGRARRGRPCSPCCAAGWRPQGRYAAGRGSDGAGAPPRRRRTCSSIGKGRTALGLSTSTSEAITSISPEARCGVGVALGPTRDRAGDLEAVLVAQAVRHGLVADRPPGRCRWPRAGRGRPLPRGRGGGRPSRRAPPRCLRSAAVRVPASWVRITRWSPRSGLGGRPGRAGVDTMVGAEVVVGRAPRRRRSASTWSPERMSLTWSGAPGSEAGNHTKGMPRRSAVADLLAVLLRAHRHLAGDAAAAQVGRRSAREPGRPSSSARATSTALGTALLPARTPSARSGSRVRETPKEMPTPG